MSSWKLVDPGQANLGVDVADAATMGLTTVLPINAKIYGSYFNTGLEKSAKGAMSAQLTGYGAGVGIGAGWGLPFIAAGATGKLSGLKRKVAESLGGGIQGSVIDKLKGGWSGGTPLVAGPDTNGDLTLDDFHDGMATIIGLGANFVVNGVSCGLIMFSKKQPIVEPADMVYVKAIGLMAGVGLAVSLDLATNSLFYKTKIGAG
jgi:hypothetical protein